MGQMAFLYEFMSVNVTISIKNGKISITETLSTFVTFTLTVFHQSDNGYKTSVGATAKATSLKAYSSHFVASGQASWSDNTSVTY